MYFSLMVYNFIKKNQTLKVGN